MRSQASRASTLMPAAVRRQRLARVLTALLMSLLLAFVISSATTAIHLGLSPALPGEVLRRFALAAPIAFPTAWLAAPEIRALVERLVGPPPSNRAA